MAVADHARDYRKKRASRRSVARAGAGAILMALLATYAFAAPMPPAGDAPLFELVAKNEPSPETIFSYDALCVRQDPEHGWRPCRGIAQDGLAYQEFFRVAGRRDLADADERRWWRRQIAIEAGAAVAVIGVASLVPQLFGRPITPLWLSAGVIVGGGGICLWGTQISQGPLVGPGEAADLARSYNQGLRERLGLPPLDGRRLAIGVGYRRVF